MYQTIRLSSCVSVQGECVAVMTDGQVVIRVGDAEYRGLPIERRARPRVALAERSLAPERSEHQSI